MDSQRSYARLAGAMYLVVLVLDVGGAVIGTAVSGSGSFADISHRIIGAETLYRVGLCLALAGSLSTVVLAAALFATLRAFDANLASIALLFRVCEAAIGGMGIALAFWVLQINLASAQAGGFDTRQLGQLADLASHDATTQVAAIFFSLGSTVFFYAFWRS
jgi:hypothetical protein